MKKAKRIVALVLVMTFVFAVMAMSASAATSRGAGCASCGRTNVYTSTSLLQTYTEYVGGCVNHTLAHNHTHKQYKVTAYCNECGYSTSSTYWTSSCPFA